MGVLEIMDFLGLALLILGFVLVGVEMVIPGFGAPGLAGATSLILGIIVSADSVEQGITITIIVVVLLAVMLTVILTILKKVRHPLVLKEDLKVEHGFLSSQDLDYLVGKSGIASTDLRPSGKCSIEGVEFDVRTQGKYILKGTRIKILCIHENTIIVIEE